MLDEETKRIVDSFSMKDISRYSIKTTETEYVIRAGKTKNMRLN